MKLFETYHLAGPSRQKEKSGILGALPSGSRHSPPLWAGKCQRLWDRWKSEELHGKKLLGCPRTMRVWVQNNMSIAQGLCLLTRESWEAWICSSLSGAGGKSAKQNKVALRTKWLNQVKSDFRADISPTLTARFPLFSAFEPQ